MNISQETSENISDQRVPSPPGSAGLTPLESIKHLFWPESRPASPNSPRCLGTFEGLHPFRIPDIVITMEEEEEEEAAEEKQQEEEDSDDSGEALISPYTDPEDSDSEGEDARSRWSESSSSDDGESDYGTGGDVSDGDSGLAPLPVLCGSPVIIQSTFREIMVEEDEENIVMREEEEEEEDNSNNYQDGAVDDMEEEYGRPWGGAMPRWKWLQSSDSLPMYNLGPEDFRHGTSKLKRAMSPDDEDDDDDDDDSDDYPDSDSTMISPLSAGGFDSDAEVVAVIEMEEVVEVVEMVGEVPQRLD